MLKLSGFSNLPNADMVNLEVMTRDDLAAFAEDLLAKAKSEMRKEQENEISRTGGDTLLTKEETKKLLKVCDTTLWLWAQKRYLMPVKVGRKNMYRSADINRILGDFDNTQI